ncbi:MAG: hypothetical protein GXO43_06925 [Crenarchaeota archaeon]|nr:hypothetical protein [Thermoproteota archaeon]
MIPALSISINRENDWKRRMLGDRLEEIQQLLDMETRERSQRIIRYSTKWFKLIMNTRYMAILPLWIQELMDRAKIQVDHRLLDEPLAL